MSDRNRRRSERHPTDFFVQETLGERTYLHPAINLSSTGIYILVSDDRKAVDGELPITLEFTLPSGQPIEVVGQVRWVDDRGGQRGVGIQFSNLDDEQREALERYVGGTAGSGTSAGA